MALPGRVSNDPSNYISIGVQSAKDTVATTFYYFKHLSGSGFDVTQEIQSEREGGSGREIGLRRHRDFAHAANVPGDAARSKSPSRAQRRRPPRKRARSATSGATAAPGRAPRGG